MQAKPLLQELMYLPVPICPSPSSEKHGEEREKLAQQTGGRTHALPYPRVL